MIGKRKVFIVLFLFVIICAESAYSLQNKLGFVIANYLGKGINIQETIERGSENMRSIFTYCRRINKLTKNDTYMIETALNDNYLEVGDFYAINWNYNFENGLFQYIVLVRIDSVYKDGSCSYTWWDNGIYTYYY